MTMDKVCGFSEGKRGAMIAFPVKTHIAIMLDGHIIESFRNTAKASGRGYQTMINEALRQAVDPESAPVTLRGLQKVLDERLSV